MLIVYPIGLLSLVWPFDIVRLATGQPVWAHIAFWLCTCGLAGGVLAAVAGLVDFSSIPRGTRAFRVGLTHLGINLVAVALFVISWILRLTEGIANTGVVPFVLAIIGFGVMAVGGWFGGELVERLGVGVHPDASLNAPSSLDAERLVARPTTHPSPREPQPA